MPSTFKRAANSPSDGEDCLVKAAAGTLMSRKDSQCHSTRAVNIYYRRKNFMFSEVLDEFKQHDRMLNLVTRLTNKVMEMAKLTRTLLQTPVKIRLRHLRPLQQQR